ncbi:MAG: DUF1236 domain-containing protein [Bradyrhizobium sp.]|uniref:DUF1236 domain-containing protein n=1 Tax=Bradyrhizobium sp. TaxID=376 RepID=UPI0025BB71AD|nr:DUF1236 domain-containing protein [Bradyrhizobium sp.]MBI5265126.1 DUF1236 domain-containing protein [Bradyrhizobium sp.]
MTNRFMISVAALALLAGTGFANAQGMSDKGGSGAQYQQPSGGAAERGGSMGKQDSKQESMGKQEKGTVGQGQSGSMKSGQSTEDRPSGAMKKDQSADDKAGATKGSRAEDRAQGQQQGQQPAQKSKSSGTETKGGQKDMKAEDSKSGGDTQMRQGQTGTGAQGQTGTAQGQTGTTTSTQTTGQAGAGAKLSTEQRTQITSVIREQRVTPVNNVNFTISVGTRVPREGIELHALPPRVVSIYPEWRTYKYILVRDEIVIIDPNTYEIVAVLNV